ncbi:UNVERIFIED_CONTAM: hypothetical protein HDU68_001593 [Siphonaria sp. JEL0065]|nr:hypothetical protein HDU68_001593 [Siphonaria sp. JEL0065]
MSEETLVTLDAALTAKAQAVEVDEETVVVAESTTATTAAFSNGTLATMLETSLAKVLSQVLQPQLEHIMNKLDLLDGRLGAVEAKLQSSLAAPKPKDNYHDGMQQATATMMQEQLLGLSASVETLVTLGQKTENVLADSVDNMTWALDSFQQQQEQLQNQAPLSPTPSTSEESMDRISEAIKAMNERMASVEKISTTLIPEIVSKGLEQIAAKQTELDQEMRASLASVQSGTQDTELLAKLNDLETKFTTLPQMYIDTVTVSLQKQTKSLLNVIDDIKEHEKEAMNNARPVSSNNRASQAIPTIPNMGIASRIAKLNTMVRNRLSSSEHDLPHDPIVPAAAESTSSSSKF